MTDPLSVVHWDLGALEYFILQCYGLTWPCSLLRILCVDINNLLHLVVASHEDTRPIMNILGHNLHHALHPAVDRLSASYVPIRLA